MNSAIKKIASTLSLFILASFLTISLFTIFTKNTYANEGCPDTSSAQGTIDDLNKTAIKKNRYDDKIFNLNQIAGTTDSLLTLLTGCSQVHPETNVATAGTGALAAGAKLVASLYGAPPISGVTYFSQEFKKLNPVQPAYAATSTGFTVLQPVQKIWTIFRNIAYVGFVIVFVVIGFMIMFRAHISPQAVATVQDSIPRIIIALILVTFSYAIAGLMIDLMFVILNVAINALQTAGLILPANKDYVFQHNIIGAILDNWTSIFRTTFNAVFGIIQTTIGLPGALNNVLGFFGGGIVGILLGIAALFVIFRVFIMLLMAYVTIILLTMISPFFFLIQALPGNNSAKDWFKQMTANVAVFPAAAIMFTFAAIFANLKNVTGVDQSVIGSQNVSAIPLFSSGINADDIGKLIGLGILLMIPSAAQLVKDMLGVKGGPQMGAAAGAMIGAAGATIGRPAGAIGGVARQVLVNKYSQQRQERGTGQRQPPAGPTGAPGEPRQQG